VAIYKFLVTRQLAGYSGDKYINVNRINDFNTLYNRIIDPTDILTVNAEPTEADGIRNWAVFKISDRLLNQSFEVHIVKNQIDGLRLTLTNYINFMKTTPSQLLIIELIFNDDNCSLYVKSESIYKYILEKHQRHNVYRIIMDEVPTNYTQSIESISANTNEYLEHFGILAVPNTRYRWKQTEFNCYQAENSSKKYIGVPYTTALPCDYFDNIEEII
jgi:hypothetical protein